jgi:hypothetical protein
MSSAAGGSQNSQNTNHVGALSAREQNATESEPKLRGQKQLFAGWVTQLKQGAKTVVEEQRIVVLTAYSVFTFKAKGKKLSVSSAKHLLQLNRALLRNGKPDSSGSYTCELRFASTGKAIEPPLPGNRCAVHGICIPSKALLTRFLFLANVYALFAGRQSASE